MTNKKHEDIRNMQRYNVHKFRKISVETFKIILQESNENCQSMQLYNKCKFVKMNVKSAEESEYIQPAMRQACHASCRYKERVINQLNTLINRAEEEMIWQIDTDFIMPKSL